MNRDRTALAYGGCAILAVLLALEWRPASDDADVVRPAMTHPASAHPPAAGAPRDTGSWVSAILARPLFTVDRRPQKITASGRLASTDMPRLAGILITPYGRRAIFMPDAGKPIVLGEGGIVGTDVIRAIEPDRVLVGAKGSETALFPTFDKHPQAGTPTLPGVYAPQYQNPQFPIGPNGAPIFRPGLPPGMAPGMTPGIPPGLQPGVPQPIQPAAAAPNDSLGDGENLGAPPPGSAQPNTSRSDR